MMKQTPQVFVDPMAVALSGDVSKSEHASGPTFSNYHQVQLATRRSFHMQHVARQQHSLEHWTQGIPHPHMF